MSFELDEEVYQVASQYDIQRELTKKLDYNLIPKH